MRKNSRAEVFVLEHLTTVSTLDRRKEEDAGWVGPLETLGSLLGMLKFKCCVGTLFVHWKSRFVV